MKPLLDNHDLILLDINLPGIDGFQIFKEIRLVNKQIPVIAATAMAMNDQQTKYKEIGFSDFVLKPFDLDALLLKINSHL